MTSHAPDSSPTVSSDSTPHPAIVFAVIFVGIFLLHFPLLQLPYFWDEAGYYVPAARDILLRGSFIPITTPSNAHPPLVMAWVALWWKVFGYAPAVTHSAMLVISAFSLLGVFHLARRVANKEVAIASTVCTALYPVFFAQSSLLHVDLAAAGLTIWGLCAYFEDSPMMMALWFSLAALTKETAILAPLSLLGWEVLQVVSLKPGAPFLARSWREKWGFSPTPFQWRRLVSLLIPAIPLALWYAYHYHRTGYVLGNPEFFRYNVAATMTPLRVALALLMRLWQSFGYLHLWLLTAAMLLAMLLKPVSDEAPPQTRMPHVSPPLRDVGTTAAEPASDRVGADAFVRPVEQSSTPLTRQRVPTPIQLVFLVIVAAYIVPLSIIGGAVLARYMLTVVPLVVIVAVSTLRRRLRHWYFAIAAMGLAFVAGWFWNPPYGFSPEDNLAYRDFIVLHESAERFLEARYPMARVLTAWPASGELTSPWLGYITRPMKVMQIENFSLDEVLSAAEVRDKYEVALVFSTKYDPPHPMLQHWQGWQAIKRRYFDYHVDLPPAAVAQILGGKVVYSEEKQGQWVAVIEMEKNEIRDARASIRSQYATGCPQSSDWFQPGYGPRFKLREFLVIEKGQYVTPSVRLASSFSKPGRHSRQRVGENVLFDLIADHSRYRLHDDLPTVLRWTSEEP